MGKLIEYIGQTFEIADYEEEHHYDKQATRVNGYPVNPVLRPGFDSTPHEDRDPQEVADWWEKPFIKTCHWEEIAETWESYADRMTRYGGLHKNSRIEFESNQEAMKCSWYQSWPTGIRFEVRSLDGGAWDRSTGIAMVKNLEEAVEAATRYSNTPKPPLCSLKLENDE